MAILNSQVKIRGTYWTKISGKTVQVSIDDKADNGAGWIATNLKTSKKVNIKSAKQLDLVVEGKNLNSDRKLAKLDLFDLVAGYLNIKPSDIRSVKTTTDLTIDGYDVDLKNGDLLSISLEELNQPVKVEKVAKEETKPAKKSTQGDRNRLPKTRKPASFNPVDKEDIKPVRKGTKTAKIIEILINGATIDDICSVSGWDRKSAHGQVRGGLSRNKGYGIKQEDDKYYLVFPQGLNEVIYS